MTTELRTMGPDDVERASAGGAVLLDFRDLEDVAASRIPGAVFIDFNARSVPRHVPAVAPPGSRVVLIGDEDRVVQIHAWFESAGGYEVLGWMEGGMGSWTAAGNPWNRFGASASKSCTVSGARTGVV